MISRFVAARGHRARRRGGGEGFGKGGNSGGGNKRARGSESKPCCGAFRPDRASFQPAFKRPPRGVHGRSRPRFHHHVFVAVVMRLAVVAAYGGPV